MVSVREMLDMNMEELCNLALNNQWDMEQLQAWSTFKMAQYVEKSIRKEHTKRGERTMSKQNDLEVATETLLNAFGGTKTDDMGCIFYIFDKSENGGGTGFSTRNSDTGDALVAIKRIMKRFKINQSALMEALQ